MTRTRTGLVVRLGLLLALALAVAGCGAGDKTSGVASLGDGKATATTSPGASSDPQQAALAYARCMRQHGIDMPDPELGAGDRVGFVLPQGVSEDDPKFKAAQQACQQYLPNGGEPEKIDPQTQQQMLAYARCMRQQGIDMPDPEPGGGFNIRGVGPDDPKFKAADQACQQYLPEGGGGRVDSGPQGPGGSK